MAAAYLLLALALGTFGVGAKFDSNRGLSALHKDGQYDKKLSRQTRNVEAVMIFPSKKGLIDSKSKGISRQIRNVDYGVLKPRLSRISNDLLKWLSPQTRSIEDNLIPRSKTDQNFKRISRETRNNKNNLFNQSKRKKLTDQSVKGLSRQVRNARDSVHKGPRGGMTGKSFKGLSRQVRNARDGVHKEHRGGLTGKSFKGLSRQVRNARDSVHKGPRGGLTSKSFKGLSRSARNVFEKFYPPVYGLKVEESEVLSRLTRNVHKKQLQKELLRQTRHARRFPYGFWGGRHVRNVDEGLVRLRTGLDITKQLAQKLPQGGLQFGERRCPRC